MAIRFVNDSVKIYLAQKGVPSVLFDATTPLHSIRNRKHENYRLEHQSPNSREGHSRSDDRGDRFAQP